MSIWNQTAKTPKIVGGMAVAKASYSPGFQPNEQALCAVDAASGRLLVDAQRTNSQGAYVENQALTLVPSAARTATAVSAPQINPTARGVQVILTVSAASGTGGLTPAIQGQDPVSGVWYNLNAAPPAVVAAGTTVYELCPGAGAAAGNVAQRTAGALPLNWRVSISAGDGSSYTYSVAACLLC